MIGDKLDDAMDKLVVRGYYSRFSVLYRVLNVVLATFRLVLP